VEGRDAVADAQACGDVAEHVDPAGLAGDVRIDKGHGGVETAVAIGGDEAEVVNVQALIEPPQTPEEVVDHLLGPEIREKFPIHLGFYLKPEHKGMIEVATNRCDWE